MADGGMVTLLILAAVTVFLVLRLKNVLGTKTGHEKPPKAVFQSKSAERESPVENAEAPVLDDGDPLSPVFAKMQEVEPGFSPDSFADGAKGAYEMLLMAFENGEKATLQKFLSPDVYQGFAQVIDERANAGLTVDARFVGLREAELVDARFDEEDQVAEIEMKFVGELVTVVRDKEHRIVEGDPNEIRREYDQWTFGRKMGSSDPNWLLIATGA